MRGNLFILVLTFFALGLAGEWKSSNCFVPGETGCAPQCMVIGSMKCGTTSLYSYLLQHPQFLPILPDAMLQGRRVLAQKETRFFGEPLFSTLTSSPGGVDAAVEDYLSLFPYLPYEIDNTKQLITGEASPTYVTQSGVAKRIHNALPYIKMIWLMRNPIDRAYSEYWFLNSLSSSASRDEHWIEEVSQGFELCMNAEIEIMHYCNISSYLEAPSKESFFTINRCLDNTIEMLSLVSGACNTNSEYYQRGMCVPAPTKALCRGFGKLKNGLYEFILVNEWLSVFQHSQLLLITSEKFYEETPEVMDQISHFLELQPLNWTAITKHTFNIAVPGTLSSDHHHMKKETDNAIGIGEKDNNEESYPPLDPQYRATLHMFFQPFNERLQPFVDVSKWVP